MTTVSALAVRVSSSVAQFTSGMSRAESSTDDLGLSLRRLGMIANDTEGELDSAGRSALTTAGMFSALSFSSDGAAVSVGTLSGALTLSLIPALLTVSTVLAPLIGALGGFVAIAGAVAGVGIAGTLGAVATETGRLRARFTGLLDIIKDEFAPVFGVAADVISQLLLRLGAIIPRLVPTQDVVEQIGDSFLALGSAIIESLPAFADLATELATEFLPPFVAFTEDVLPRVPGMIRGLVDVFRDLLPMFRDAGRAVWAILPDLTEFGMTVLSVVAPALGTLTSLLHDGLVAFNSLDAGMQSALVKATLLAPVLAGLSGPLGIAALAVGGLAAAWGSNFADIRTTTSSGVSTIRTTIASGLAKIRENLGPLREEIAAFGRAFETATAIGIDALVGLVDFLVGAFLGTINLTLDFLAGDWGGAWRTISEGTKDTLNGLLSFANKWGDEFIQNVVAGLGKSVSGLSPAARNTLAAMLPGITGGTLDTVATLASTMDAEQSVASNQTRTPQFQRPPEPGRGDRRGVGEIRVTGRLVEEDGEIVAKIDEQIQQNDRQQSRELRQLRGRDV
jgi:phage-related protein